MQGYQWKWGFDETASSEFFLSCLLVLHRQKIKLESFSIRGGYYRHVARERQRKAEKFDRFSSVYNTLAIGIFCAFSVGIVPLHRVQRKIRILLPFLPNLFDKYYLTVIPVASSNARSIFQTIDRESITYSRDIFPSFYFVLIFHANFT